MRTSRVASEQIIAEVGTWPGVEVGPGNRGASVAFRVGRRELGHLHGDRSAHFSFPKKVWDELRRQARIVPHPVFPHARGPAARAIKDESDVADVIELLRLNYERLLARSRASDHGNA
jgi:Family of unknown function (DUF5519)